MQQKAEKAQSIGEAILLQALRGTGLLECALLMDCSVSTELEWRQCWDRRLRLACWGSGALPFCPIPPEIRTVVVSGSVVRSGAIPDLFPAVSLVYGYMCFI